MKDERYNLVRPDRVLSEVAEVVPESVLGNITIIGSLAAAYWLLDSKGVRTKDVDCVLSPRLSAVEKGRLVTEELLKAGWKQMTTGDFGKPGDQNTPEDRLPAVRLHPPEGKKWFLELLTEPEPGQEVAKDWTRLSLGEGKHFGIPSLRFLSIAVFGASMTDFGLRVARPEMMALANLLEHPGLKSDLISGTEIKRCNKDLGRVLAIAYLTKDKDQMEWPEIWVRGMSAHFQEEAKILLGRAGDGLREMLDSPEDMQQAYQTCVNGLLAGKGATIDQLRAVGKRILGDVIDRLQT